MQRALPKGTIGSLEVQINLVCPEGRLVALSAPQNLTLQNPQHFDHIPFAQLPMCLMMSHDLSDGAKKVWCALAQHAGGAEDPYAWPSVATMAEIALLSERHCFRLLEELEKAGAIAKLQEHPNRPSVYWLNFRFGEDEAKFQGLMQKRAERQQWKRDGEAASAAIRQAEMDFMQEHEGEQLNLLCEEEAPQNGSESAPQPHYDIWVSGHHDTQMSGHHDTQMSDEPTQNQQQTNPPHPQASTSPTPSSHDPHKSMGGRELKSLFEDLKALFPDEKPTKKQAEWLQMALKAWGFAGVQKLLKAFAASDFWSGRDGQRQMGWRAAVKTVLTSEDTAKRLLAAYADQEKAAREIAQAKERAEALRRRRDEQHAAFEKPRTEAQQEAAAFGFAMMREAVKGHLSGDDILRQFGSDKKRQGV